MTARRISRREFQQRIGGIIGGGVAASLLGQSAGGSPAPPAATAWRDSWRPEQPGRLPSTTHELARRALAGEHGRSMREAAFACGLEAGSLSPDRRYSAALRLIAQQAPLRILPGEKIVGSATLREAAEHRTPVAGVGSTSHTTIGFHRVLKTGYRGLRRQIEERIARGGFTDPPAPGGLARGEDFLRSMAECLDAAAIWHGRHMDRLEELASAATDETERNNYHAVRATLARVPENPPETFREAVQSLWFMYAFQRLAGTWSGIGRIDEMLGPYLDHDLRSGTITRDEARDLLAHFWINGCEWIGVSDKPGSGDAQFYQNIILAGVDADGREVTNDVTYLVLDVVEELHISDFPIAVRVNRNTPARLLRRVAEVQRHGGGIVAIYNEDVVIAGLVKFGYPLEEARTFTNDGCWEMLIPGRTNFIYSPFDTLALLHETLGLRDTSKPAPEFETFDRLYAAFVERLAARLDEHQRAADSYATGGPPSPLVSLFVEDCIERARGYYDRGARYNVLAPHAGGLANTGNSLLVLKKLVYEERYLTLPEFVRILRDNWSGSEHLRRLIQTRFEFHGNDNDETDAMVKKVFDDYTSLAGRVPERNGVKRPAGISTFGREIEWSTGATRVRTASPDGHPLGAVLATNFSPSPGTDRKGPTAVLKSHCKMDFTRTPNGATVELKVMPSSVCGDAGRDALVALMRSFVKLGGLFLHIDVVDSAMLIDAQRHPDRYPNLSVRIAGWSARFATMDENWQNMVIQRTQQRA